jgi:4-hydroxy-2-oxoheptanedioate aldolase
MNSAEHEPRYLSFKSLPIQARPVIGLWSTLADPVVAELLAQCNPDYLCLDLQHGLAGPDSIPALVRAVRACQVTPLVRTQAHDQAQVMRSLDLGAAGVLIPMVSTEQDAIDAVAACRYPSLGIRSWGPIRAVVERASYTPEQSNRDVFCGLIIETALGLTNIDAIAAVPGVDALYIGPTDLAISCGLGLLRYPDSPELCGYFDRVAEAADRHGLIAGLHCSDVQMARDWSDRGFRMFTVGADIGLITSAARSLLDSATALSKDRVGRAPK